MAFNIFKKTEKKSNPQAFSTPFLKVGKGDLTAPYVDSYYTLQGIVQFGESNLYPQLLNQLYYQSPIHGACLDFTKDAVIGGGWEWDTPTPGAKEAIELRSFEKKNRLNSLIDDISMDWVIHRRITLLICINASGQPYKIKRFDPATIRHDKDKKVFRFNSDWSRGLVESKTYPAWEPGIKQDAVYCMQKTTPGQEIYAIPQYNSVLNWAFLDSEYSYFHKSNLQHGIFPSLAIRRPKEFGSLDEMQEFKEQISMKTGASNGGRVMVLTGNGMDDVPEIVSINSNTNDKAFEWTSKELKENICIGHKINPSIMGIKVSGQLGATTEIKDSYMIFEKIVVMPMRRQIEEVINDILEIFDVKNTITIRNFQIIDGEITEK